MRDAAKDAGAATVIEAGEGTARGAPPGPKPSAAITLAVAAAAAAVACALSDAWRLKERRSISKKAKKTALLMPLLSARGPTPLKKAVGPPCTLAARTDR